MWLAEFSRDFVIAFIAYSGLLGVLLLVLGVILAGCGEALHNRTRGGKP